jgi:hypothetical protein
MPIIAAHAGVQGLSRPGKQNARQITKPVGLTDVINGGAKFYNV